MLFATRAQRGLVGLARRLQRWCRSERGAEVPEYVIVIAIVAMLAVTGLVSVKTGLLSNLQNIATCLTSTAAGTADSCL